MMCNKILFNRLEQDTNLDALRESYQVDCLEWNFIKSLYSIARRVRREHLYYEKNFKYSAERVIPRLLDLLQWISDEENLNRNNSIYLKLLKE